MKSCFFEVTWQIPTLKKLLNFVITQSANEIWGKLVILAKYLTLKPLYDSPIVAGHKMGGIEKN